MSFWDDNATREGVFNVGDMYDEYTRRQAAFIVEQLGAKSGCLGDIGCGVGRLSFAVADHAPFVDVIGVDPSPPMIEVALEQLRVSTVSHRVAFGLQGDRLWHGAEPIYDGAWCVLTFQHLPDHTVYQHLRDLFEILKPGARLVTQWVTAGDEAPRSYPRPWQRIHDLHREAGFGLQWWAGDHMVTGYAPNWLWVVAEKPA